jgi:putative hydrolase of the HAD superfamily
VSAAATRPRPIRGVFFDLGGVLIDNTGLAQMLAWMPAPLTGPELARRWLLSPAARAFESGRIATGPFLQSLIGEFDLDVDPGTLEQAFAGWIRGPYPGAFELLDSLRGSVILACVSNTNAIHWRRMVEEMGLDGRFDHCIASHLVGYLKPEPEIFRIALARTGLGAAESLFLDDHPMNVEGARAEGWNAMVVRTLDEIRAALREHGLRGAG